MSKTISADSGAVKLISPSDNPLIILGGVTVSGPSYGVSGDSSEAWTVTNQGTVIGTAGDGVYLAAGGMVTNNTAAARISGGMNGVNIINGAAAITNHGAMSGTTGDGVYLKAGGSVTNSGAAADITGGKWGVFAAGSAPMTVTNGGTISGATGAVHFDNGNGNVFRVLPGAVTTGIVQGGTGVDTLALGTAHSFGVISGIGSQFTAFEVLEVDTTAIGLVTGANTLGKSATIDLAGTGSLRVAGTLIAPTNLTITGDGTLAASGGRIEVGTGGAALANQIVVDAGHTLITSGVLSAQAIRNRGIVSGSYGFGMHLAGAGTVTNGGGVALISGTDAGVFATGGVLTVANNGTAAHITGGLWGVYASGSAATISNQGGIAGTFGDGVYLGAGGTMTNSGSAASVAGGINGVNAIGGVASITNQGSIAGASGDGVYLGAGGSVTASGSDANIKGGQWGVYASAGAATVTNQGTLSGTTGAVHFANANGNVFHDFPGAVTNGVVRGGTGADKLELGSSASAGTITGIGSLFTGFEALAVDTGAHWVMTGANAIGATTAVEVAGTGSLGVTGTLTAPANLTTTGAGTLAASGGRIEVGTSGAALADQIRVDTGHTLNSGGGVLSATTLIVATGGLLIGSGKVAGAVANSGEVEASGALTITGNATSSGTLRSNSTGSLTLNGASNTATTVLDNGAVAIGAGDTFDVTGSVDPASEGLFNLNNNSLLKVAADTGFGDKMSFLGANGELVIDEVAKFGTNVGKTTYRGPLLEHFRAGEEIDLKDLKFAGVTGSFVPPIGQLQLASGATKATLEFQTSSLIGSTFHFTNDGSGHVLVTIT